MLYRLNVRAEILNRVYFCNNKKKRKMLKEYLEIILELIGDLNVLAERYTGQLEEGAEWTPQLPCALIDITGSVPTVHSSDDRVLAYNADMDIYIGSRVGDAVEGLDLIEQIESEISGNIHTRIRWYESHYIGFQRIGFRQGGVTIYRMKFSVGFRSEIS